MATVQERNADEGNAHQERGERDEAFKDPTQVRATAPPESIKFMIILILYSQFPYQ